MKTMLVLVTIFIKVLAQPYTILLSSNCESEGLNNFDHSSCQSTSSNGWVQSQLGAPSNANVNHVNFPFGPTGCIYDYFFDEWLYNSNQNSVHASDDYAIVCEVAVTPTKNPTSTPTQRPSPRPTPRPTPNPTPNPTRRPTPKPTHNPTSKPTFDPTDIPTDIPTYLPSSTPTTTPSSGSPTCAPTTDCVEIEQNWTKEIAEQLCSVGQMGHTNKGVDAVVCPEYNQYYQRRLNYSLANRAYRSCSAWCVYDSHPEGYGDASEAFIWRKRGCWKPTRTGLCIFGNTQDRELMAEYVEYTLCKPCIPFNTWSEDRAEEICPSIVSADKSYGAEVCDDPNSSTKQDNLDKSLANRFFTQCTSYCVYDYETIMSNGGSYGGFMWKQTCWKWVTSWDCFGKHISEFTDVSSRAANFCE